MPHSSFESLWKTDIQGIYLQTAGAAKKKIEKIKKGDTCMVFSVSPEFFLPIFPFLIFSIFSAAPAVWGKTPWTSVFHGFSNELCGISIWISTSKKFPCYRSLRNLEVPVGDTENVNLAKLKFLQHCSSSDRQPHNRNRSIAIIPLP